MDVETQNITEQQYLELSRDSQQRFTEMERKLKGKDEEIAQVKKELISCYGFIRIIDNLYQEHDEQEPSILNLLEVIREHVSNVVEDLIL